MNVSVITWNVSGINNNPFEFHTDFGDEGLNKSFATITDKAKECIEGSTQTVKEVFTEDLYSNKLLPAIKNRFAEETSAVKTMEDFWLEICDEKVSSFFKHSLVEEKRLFSWPDRYINMPEGEKRPTVINTYSFDNINNLNDWWSKWEKFMFEDTFSKGKGAVSLLKPNKYLEGDKGESPLQILALALYDSILYNVLENTETNWKDIKNKICNSGMVNPDKKVQKAKEILMHTDLAADIVFLQEVGKDYAGDNWQLDQYIHASPETIGAQNSLILLKKSVYESCQPITQEVLDTANESLKKQYAFGDLVVAIGMDKNAKGYFFASVHADSKGETSVEVIQLLINYAQDHHTAFPIIIGMDGNTVKTAAVQELIRAFEGSCASIYSDSGFEVSQLPHTTQKQRTYLQPQLNAKKLKLDKSLKDYIIFTKNKFSIQTKTIVDTVANGSRPELKSRNLPTPDFPSDHCLVRATLSTD